MSGGSLHKPTMDEVNKLRDMATKLRSISEIIQIQEIYKFSWVNPYPSIYHGPPSSPLDLLCKILFTFMRFLRVF